MSYIEYQDLYDKCQEYALYHLFVFDVVGSKQISKIDNKYIAKISLLIAKVYQKIEQIEKKENRKIIHHSPYISHPKLYEYTPGYFIFDDNNLDKEKIYRRADLQDPFQICGDTIGLTIIRDSLKTEEVYALFDQTKEELNIPYEFHYANCFYETDDYVEGGTKLFRGYAIQLLAEQHKKKNKTKNKVKTKK